MWNIGALWKRASRSTMSATVRPESSSARRGAGLGPDGVGALGRPPEPAGDVMRPSTVSTTSRMVTSVGGAPERVAALHAALALQDPRPAQAGEELLEEVQRDPARLGHLQDRHGRRRARAGRAP